MIYIFSNVPFTNEQAPKVQDEDLLIFLNKAVNIQYYLDHKDKIIYRRRRGPKFGEDVPGCVTVYIEGRESIKYPEYVYKTLTHCYDFSPGKHIKKITTGYAVAMYFSLLCPEDKIVLVNFGFKVKHSTRRNIDHNWRFEDRVLSRFKHIYTE